MKENEAVEVLLDLGNGLVIAKAHINALREQDLNARFMPREMFKQLRDNIKKRGALESLPFCAKTERGIEIVSGHHRVRAARYAGINEIYILLDVSGLTRDQIIAKQLAHNSISGMDDKDILRKLYEQINDLDARIEAFIDPRDLGIEIKTDVDIPPLNVGLEHKIIKLVFLPYQAEDFEEVISKLSGDEDMIGVADIKHFDKFKEAVKKVQGVENIKTVSHAVARMSEIVLEHYKAEEAEKPAPQG